MDVADCRLQLLVTRSLCREPWAEVVAAAVRGGVDLLQVREKGASRDELVRLAGEVLELAAPAGVPVLINDDVEAARQLPVQGVHVGQGDLAPAEARRILGPEAWIGVSTHSLEEVSLRRFGGLAASGATHLGLGACFPTGTRPNSSVLSREVLVAALRCAPLPVFAIGGITPDNAAELAALGVRRVAVSSAILGSSDPEAAAARIARSLSA